MYRWVRQHYQFQLRGRRFLEAPWSGGLVLLISVAVAMLLANLPLTADGYQRLLNIDDRFGGAGIGGNDRLDVSPGSDPSDLCQ